MNWLVSSPSHGHQAPGRFPSDITLWAVVRYILVKAWPHYLSMNMAEIIEVERHLGFILKEKQREVIAAFVKGNNVFTVLPTGFGKTLSVSTDNTVNSIVNIFLSAWLQFLKSVYIVLRHKSGTFFQHIHYHHESVVINININLQFIKLFCY